MSVKLSAAQHVEMFTPSFSSVQQKELAKRLTAFLSQYSYLSDSFIIEFFSENLWHTLPRSWQTVLQHLSYPQIADLLLDASHNDRRYPSVWPLSLLAFRATSHALAFPREGRRDGGRVSDLVKPEEFMENRSQSSLLGHIFRKHVKPKKQHEIRKLGMLVKQLCDQTSCRRVVDVGSGQGHLTRFLSFGLGLSVTAIEADHDLVSMASRYDSELLWVLQKEKQKKICFSQLPETLSIPRHVVAQSTVLLTKAANQEETSLPSSPDFVLTGLHACGDLSATLLRHFVSCPHIRSITSVACCYMKITTKESPTPPGLVTPPSSLAPASESFPSDFGYPMSSWVRALPGHQLSYKAREGACHAVEDYVRRLREGSELLRTHCYRAMLEAFIRETRPDLRRAGIQTIKKAHLLPFTEYARLGLTRVSLPPDLPLDPDKVEAMLAHQSRVVVYFSLALLLAPVVETLVLLDRMIYLQENGMDSQLVPLFDPHFSPRNFVLVSLKPSR
ncbi:LOW QUALITY PROTEIN: methyltransferase-like protein 25B [Austrofundulus limnaeus]|uniref:LOW QUALITY PROTEIN: methyltransferase-like protein 25B n=1 Tax=Austrofundulus limnaeus TaxID=52670 RepID=A0A2I4CJ63_AUSLI|nr:PREDICTED: LOW QUALITY PROTEIN: protein RRNAD1 [Austrofundulus limnaeus]